MALERTAPMLVWPGNGKPMQHGENAKDTFIIIQSNNKLF
jgi:hypothetical protein